MLENLKDAEPSAWMRVGNAAISEKAILDESIYREAVESAIRCFAAVGHDFRVKYLKKVTSERKTPRTK